LPHLHVLAPMAFPHYGMPCTWMALSTDRKNRFPTTPRMKATAHDGICI
jgi:hypothetical protein